MREFVFCFRNHRLVIRLSDFPFDNAISDELKRLQDLWSDAGIDRNGKSVYVESLTHIFQATGQPPAAFLDYVECRTDQHSAPARIRIPGWGQPNSASLLIKRALDIIIPDENAIAVHSSAVYCNNVKAVAAFSGSSGAGKSTIAQLLSDNREIFSVDRTIFELSMDSRDIVLATSTPIGDCDFLATPGVVSILAGIFFINKSHVNKAQRLAKPVAVQKLIQQSLLQKLSFERMTMLLNMAQLIVDRVPCFDLQFSLNGQLWDEIDRSLASN